MIYWFAVRTNIRAEFHAKMALEAKGFNTFLPIERVRSHHRGRREILRPVLSRYLFVAAVTQWWQVRETRGVDGLLCMTDKNGIQVPARIPWDAIDTFRRAVEAGIFHAARRSRFEAGDRARILEGPYADKIVEIARAPQGKRVRILMTMMGSVRETEIRTAELVAV